LSALIATSISEHPLVVVLEIFIFVLWLWVLIAVFSDLFRDHELSGWWKAVWIFFIIVPPFTFFTVFIYLIARGGGMQRRAIAAQTEARKNMDEYIREQAASASPADEIEKLEGLKQKGTISAEEFDTLKAKITG